MFIFGPTYLLYDRKMLLLSIAIINGWLVVFFRHAVSGKKGSWVTPSLLGYCITGDEQGRKGRGEHPFSSRKSTRCHMISFASLKPNPLFFFPWVSTRGQIRCSNFSNRRIFIDEIIIRHISCFEKPDLVHRSALDPRKIRTNILF